MLQKRTIGGVRFSWIPFLCLELLKNIQQIVCITRHNKDIRYISSVLTSINLSDSIINIPEYEYVQKLQTPYDRVVSSERAAGFAKWILSKEHNHIVITTLKAVEYALLPIEYFSKTLNISKNEAISIIKLQNLLAGYGYERVGVTEFPGQFSIRGGIVDVFPVWSQNPYRVDFDGDVVENIKEFDARSQRSIGTLSSILITKAVDNHFSNGTDSFDKNIKFVDYIPKDAVIIFDSELEKESDENSKILQELSSRFSTIKTQQFQTNASNFAKPNNFSCNIRAISGFHAFLKDSTRYKKAIIAVTSKGALHVLQNILASNNFKKYKVITKIEEAEEGISVIIASVSEGFVGKHYTLYTEKQIFGYILKVSQPSKKNLFKNYTNFIPGNYVVHQKHGIAVFNGIETISVESIKHDFLCLVYKDNDKLFVPVENINLVSRYGDNDAYVELDKLGSVAWANKKEKVRQKLLVVSQGLLRIAALRKTHKIEAIEIDWDKYDEFCKKFPYLETNDQASAIDDVQKDLQNTIPMDRLVCGDVGFGKTEVALRAAFIVAASGQQVVILAPTTILVGQHYQTFMERFEGTGIKICQLSRFVSGAQTRKNIQDIASGDVQIVIATHAVLSKKIHFHKLGLVIVDEEQHFGVRQKEFIKSIQSNIHFLTMTATPIPRTLQMALSGVRDLSIIASSPCDRLPIKTYLIDYDKNTLKEAINYELKRGGQVMVVSPRTEFLEDIQKQIAQLVDGVIIKSVHGKSSNLEEIITDFCDHKINILISTNIVDSGINIPNVNTIIIYRSDMFGLSQLYQLRGRVGRLSNVQSFAYLILPPHKKLSAEAAKRLEVIESLTNLGSGFTLASYDLDIRGAGNIVGDEQSGYIKEVGIELYQAMLEEAILIQGCDEVKKVQFTPQVNIGIPILIPSSYISDEKLRMSFYRRIGDLETLSSVETMEVELIDRFGPIPVETANLLDVIRIRQFCCQANIDRIDVGRNGVLISFYNNVFKSSEKLLSFIKKYSDFIKIRPDQKLLINKKWHHTIERTQDILKITELMSRM